MLNNYYYIQTLTIACHSQCQSTIVSPMQSTTIQVDGEFLRYTRKVAGLEIADLAALVGIHPSYVTHIERGARNPSPRLFKRICDALEIPPAKLALPPTPQRPVPRQRRSA